MAMLVATPSHSKPRTPRSTGQLPTLPTLPSLRDAASSMSLTQAADPTAHLAAPGQERIWPSEFWRPWTGVNQNGGTKRWDMPGKPAPPPPRSERVYRDPPTSAGSPARARGNFLPGAYSILTPPSTPRRVLRTATLPPPRPEWGGGLGPPLGSTRAVQAMYSERLSQPKKKYWP
jgi:hypothetical protein